MDFNSVKGKVAIVTGASRGIGRAIAECFGENGMKVVCAARSAEQGRAVADGICAKGGDAIFIQTDCSKASAIKELVDKTVTHYGKLDGVVSNAGIGMGGTNKALAPSCTGARLLEGKVFRSSTNADTLREWVKTLK